MTYPDSLLSTFELETLAGTTKPYALRLRRKGTTSWWDVHTSSLIQLEVNKAGEDAMVPIPFDPAAPGADWANGRLVGVLGPVDVAARVGSYECTITAVFAGQAYPVARGAIEVFRRPVSGPIPMPGGGFYNSSNLDLGTNASISVPIPQGTPVARTPAGLVPATADASGSLAADGIALVTIPPLQPGLIMLAGSLALPDWTTVAGTTTLDIATPYYLDVVAGKITTTLPSRPLSSLIQLIGQSEDGSTLDLQLGEYSIDI